MVKYHSDYDSENDILYITKENTKTHSSVELGNFVIDLDSKKRIVAIEMFDVIKTFRLIGKRLTKKQLSHIIKARIFIHKQKNAFLIGFAIKLPENNEEIPYQLTIPQAMISPISS